MIYLSGICICFLLPSGVSAESVYRLTSETVTEPAVEATAEEVPVNIPSIRFKKALMQLGIDTDNDGQISYAEAEVVTSLDMGVENSGILTADMLTDLTGLEAFKNLESLNVQGNLIGHLDVTGCPKLVELNCRENRLYTIDVSNCPDLEILDCSWNHLSQLDLSSNSALKELVCGYNQFTELDLSGNEALTHLTCDFLLTESNQIWMDNRPGFHTFKGLSSLDISNNLELEYLLIHGENFRNLDISSNTKLEWIFLIEMPENIEVSVWTDPFPPEGITLHMIQCGSLKFQDNVPPKLSADETTATAQVIEAASSESGTIYVVPDGTGRDISDISSASLYSVPVLADSKTDIVMDNLRNGEYWLYASDHAGNISDHRSISVTSVGIGRPNAGSINIYPNPSTEYVTIETGFAGPFSAEVYSIDGRIMLREELQASPGLIRTEELPNGTYILNVRSEGEVINRRFLKE